MYRLGMIYLIFATTLIIFLAHGGPQGLGASEKKPKKNYIILQGGELTAPIFLSRRVKLIVTSERLNIFKKMFPPVESQVIFLSKETTIVSVGLRTAEISYTNQNKTA